MIMFASNKIIHIITYTKIYILLHTQKLYILLHTQKFTYEYANLYVLHISMIKCIL